MRRVRDMMLLCSFLCGTRCDGGCALSFCFLVFLFSSWKRRLCTASPLRRRQRHRSVLRERRVGPPKDSVFGKTTLRQNRPTGSPCCAGLMVHFAPTTTCSTTT